MNCAVDVCLGRQVLEINGTATVRRLAESTCVAIRVEYLQNVAACEVEYGVLAITGLEDKSIVAGAAEERIVALAAPKCVIACVAIKRVIFRAAHD